jgi:NAD(P)-dependent dehydrogenase (short-subunit alcohol dehydrogenase family)
MLEAGRGVIVNLASQAATVALTGHAAYCASKAAVVGLTKVLAYEWGPRGIRVNAVSPTVVNTTMGLGTWSGARGESMRQAIPLRRLAEPDDIESVVIFLAASGSSMINGADVMVDGGFTIC